MLRAVLKGKPYVNWFARGVEYALTSSEMNEISTGEGERTFESPNISIGIGTPTNAERFGSH